MFLYSDEESFINSDIGDMSSGLGINIPVIDEGYNFEDEDIDTSLDSNLSVEDIKKNIESVGIEYRRNKTDLSDFKYKKSDIYTSSVNMTKYNELPYFDKVGDNKYRLGRYGGIYNLDLTNLDKQVDSKTGNDLVKINGSISFIDWIKNGVEEFNNKHKTNIDYKDILVIKLIESGESLGSNLDYNKKYVGLFQQLLSVSTGNNKDKKTMDHSIGLNNLLQSYLVYQKDVNRLEKRLGRPIPKGLTSYYMFHQQGIAGYKPILSLLGTNVKMDFVAGLGRQMLSGGKIKDKSKLLTDRFYQNVGGSKKNKESAKNWSVTDFYNQFNQAVVGYKMVLDDFLKDR